MKKIFFILILAISFIKADADLPAAKIKSVTTGWGNEGAYVVLDSDTIVDGCKNARVFIPKTNPDYSDILSIMLTSINSSSKVAFRVSGCTIDDMTGIAIAIVKSCNCN